MRISLFSGWPIYVVLLFSGLAAAAYGADSGRVEVTDMPDDAQAPAAQTPSNQTPAAQTPSSGQRRGQSSTVGRKAAQKYMGQKGRETSDSPARSASSTGGETHFLALHVGSFLSDNEYKWGAKDADSNVGRLNIGVTYRLGEWQNSMDLDARVDYQVFNLSDGTANKLSFLPVIVFPDASSKFPLYFGIGAGLGVFTKQLPSESPISFDYQLLLGVRFFNIANTHAGFFVEGGLKNHVLLLSDGQYNGAFAALGGVFTF